MQKRILFLAATAGLYGASKSLLLLLDGLREVGWEVFVVLGEEGPLAQRLQLLEIPYALIPFEVGSHKPFRSGRTGSRYPAYSLRWFGKAFRRRFTNRHSVKRIVECARRKNVSVIYSNSIMCNLASPVAAALRCPLICHVREFGELDYGFLPDFGWRQINTFLNRCQGVVYVSEALNDYYARRGQQVLPNRTVEVIYNGACGRHHMVSCREAARQRKLECARTIRIGSIGVLHRTKRHDLCIKAFAEARKKISGLKLSIAGDGLERERLQSLCNSLGVARDVEFTGYIEDVWKFYDDLNILLVASECEAMGRVTAEGMAAALPIIGRNSGATAELIGRNERGLLFDGSADDLAAKIVELSEQPARRRELSIRGNAFAQAELTKEHHVRRVVGLLERVLSLTTTNSERNVCVPVRKELTT